MGNQQNVGNGDDVVDVSDADVDLVADVYRWTCDALMLS